MKIVSININPKKGLSKLPVESVELREDFGVVGDAHGSAGSKKQVSLLPSEAILEFKKIHGAKLKTNIVYGIFGENLSLEGIDFNKLTIGTKLKIDSAEIEISEIGKTCHIQCEIGKKTGNCIMPKLGVFARVTKGGKINKDSEIAIVKTSPIFS